MLKIAPAGCTIIIPNFGNLLLLIANHQWQWSAMNSAILAPIFCFIVTFFYTPLISQTERFDSNITNKVNIIYNFCTRNEFNTILSWSKRMLICNGTDPMFGLISVQSSRKFTSNRCPCGIASPVNELIQIDLDLEPHLEPQKFGRPWSAWQDEMYMESELLDHSMKTFFRAYKIIKIAQNLKL